MGVDVSCLYKHNLPVGDLAETAKEIAGIFNICVEYGNEFEDRDNDIYEIRSEGKVGDGELYRLTKYTNDPGSKAPFYLELVKCDGVKGNALESGQVYIYQHIIESGICSTARWWGFESMVFEPNESGYLSAYRRAIQKEAAKWGATEAVYFPDSYKDKAAFIEGDSEYMTWDALMEKSRRVLGSGMIAISEVIRNKMTDLPESGVEVCFEDFSYMPPPPDVIGWHRQFVASKKGMQQDEQKEGNPLPKSDRECWHRHLVEQSKSDHIYGLIQEYLPPDFTLNHHGDYVAIAKDELPEALMGNLHLHLSKEKNKASTFTYNNIVVLDNSCLTDYLETAKKMDVICDINGFRFIKLTFNKETEEVEAKEEVLKKCRDILIGNDDKTLALPYAEAAMEYLEKQLQEIKSSPDLLIANRNKDLVQRLFEILMGFNIPAAAFAWNGLQEKAKQADKQYIHVPPLWDSLKTTIEPYLELLIASNWQDYLAWIFSSAEFRQYFNNHYEAFLSVCIDTEYPLSDPSAFVGIYNRIQHHKRTMGKYT